MGTETDIAKDVEHVNDMKELEDAWDLSEKSGDEEESSAEDTSGEEEVGVEEPDPEGEGEEGEGVKPEASKEPAPKEPQPSKEPEVAPPAGWKGVVKQRWKELPADVKQEIARRERDYAVGIQQYAETAKRASDYDRLLSPYQSLFVANGTSPVQGLQNILQTAASLQMGSASNKAKIVGDLIAQYGVDIQALDNYLSEGVVPENNQEEDRLNKLLEERLAPVNHLIQRMQGHEQQTQRQSFERANQTIQQFATDPKNIYYNDVALDMANILDAAAASNRTVTLDQAYDIACRMHPEIGPIYDSPTPSKESVERKRRASSSVSGTPPAPSKPEVPDDVRSGIEAAWDALVN